MSDFNKVVSSTSLLTTLPSVAFLLLILSCAAAAAPCRARSTDVCARPPAAAAPPPPPRRAPPPSGSGSIGGTAERKGTCWSGRGATLATCCVRACSCAQLWPLEERATASTTPCAATWARSGRCRPRLRMRSSRWGRWTGWTCGLSCPSSGSIWGGAANSRPRPFPQEIAPLAKWYGTSVIP
eukprot:7605123-Pyramimonas_sp.AAC.1